MVKQWNVYDMYSGKGYQVTAPHPTQAVIGAVTQAHGFKTARSWPTSHCETLVSCGDFICFNDNRLVTCDSDLKG